MIRLRNSREKVTISLKREILIEGVDNYVQKIKVIRFKGRLHFVLARKNGLIQLYETIRSRNKTSYLLFKEWKNSNMNNQDLIESLGLIDGQYLYSCSNEGKLIIRDLINDDEDESYKVYLINGPISSIAMKYDECSKKIVVYGAGKNNELKLYEIDVGGSVQELTFKQQNTPSGIRSTLSTSRNHLIRARYTLMSLRASNDRQVNTLIPFWMGCSYFGNFVYKSLPSESISNWIISICSAVINGREIILCGTQFGNLLVYEVQKESHPSKILPLSQFPINYLCVFKNDQLLIFSDSVSKIGIINISTFEVVNFYENLKIGPTASFEIIFLNIPNKKRKYQSNMSFDPIYVICTNITNTLMIYKLFDDNSYSLVLDIPFGFIIPSVAILSENAYSLLDDIFGERSVDDTNNVGKKRKLGSLDSICITQNSNFNEKMGHLCETGFKNDYIPTKQ